MTTGGSGGFLFRPGTRVGRYEVIRRLAIGGMAELYLARATGLDGFEKMVVLKRLLPQYADEPAAARMLLDEARLAAKLDHPHVAQVYDVGEESGTYFFTMEYVRGPTLEQILRELRERGAKMPLAHVIAIGSAVAAALHHAHERTDNAGEPLGIVHRDVSPSNVVVSWEGAIKVLDFGIAKATLTRTQTETGVIKGKYTYMSPEQCRGQTVDRRSDIYSLGIVIYELAAGERLFERGNQYEVMGRIATAEGLDESRHVPSQGLEAIVRRALRREAGDRQQTAQELQADLERLARSEGVVPSSIELAQFVTDLFPDRERAEEIENQQPSGTTSAPTSLDKPPPRPAGRKVLMLGLATVLIGAAAVTALLRKPATTPGSACLLGVAVGATHACAWTAAGAVWCWGSNQYGQLGGGKVDPERIRREPIQTRQNEGPLGRVAQVSAGILYTCAQTLDGNAWCWGANFSGQLGRGNVDHHQAFAAPVQKTNSSKLTRVASVGTGRNHACSHVRSGHVNCWGWNADGQLGTADELDIKQPLATPTSKETSYARLAVGDGHTCGISVAGEIWCWGHNVSGQLGNGQRAVKSSNTASKVVDAEGMPFKGAIQIAAGERNTCAIREDRSVWCWGSGSSGQLGTGTRANSLVPVKVELDGVVSIGVGAAHACSLRGDGMVSCWGQNESGQLGMGGSVFSSDVPVPVVTADGRPLGEVTFLAVGPYANCAIRRDGTLWCWGLNENGELFTGDNASRNVATQTRLACDALGGT